MSEKDIKVRLHVYPAKNFLTADCGFADCLIDPSYLQSSRMEGCLHVAISALGRFNLPKTRPTGLVSRAFLPPGSQTCRGVDRRAKRQSSRSWQESIWMAPPWGSASTTIRLRRDGTWTWRCPNSFKTSGTCLKGIWPLVLHTLLRTPFPDVGDRNEVVDIRRADREQQQESHVP